MWSNREKTYWSNEQNYEDELDEINELEEAESLSSSVNEVLHFQNVKYFIHSPEWSIYWSSSRMKDTSICGKHYRSHYNGRSVSDN